MIAHLRRASCPRRTAAVSCGGRGHRNKHFLKTTDAHIRGYYTTSSAT
jgi:hypothetical protein